MKIKLKKDVLESGGLPSAGSHQGFTKNIWQSLNNGDTVEVDSIPERSKNNVEQVKSKNKTEGVNVKVKKPSSIKKQEVKDGK
tara:strand:+ start:146 stop:394 length:249 start_codon:yes stop_codon:yes gene_type:complete